MQFQIHGIDIFIKEREDGYYRVIADNGVSKVEYPKAKFVLNIEAYPDEENSLMYTTSEYLSNHKQTEYAQ